MSHRIIIMKVTVLPSPDSQLAAGHSQGEMTVEVTYAPPHDATDAQIGKVVERTMRRLNKLADD